MTSLNGSNVKEKDGVSQGNVFFTRREFKARWRRENDETSLNKMASRNDETSLNKMASESFFECQGVYER